MIFGDGITSARIRVRLPRRVSSLRDWRKAQQLTQTQLGAKVGVGASQISQIETGRRGTSLDVAARIERLTEGVVTVQAFVTPEAAA